MTTKELMIGDIIGVTHEELGLVYAKVEYINETGDLMVRADNDYMNGGGMNALPKIVSRLK